MSYIQIELGGKLRGLKFNQISLEVYTKNLNHEALVTSAIYATFFAGLIGNCTVKREEPDFTYEDVCNWVDNLYENGKKDEIKKVCDIWAATHIYTDWLKEFQDKVRSIIEPEKGEGKKTNKKKVR